MNGELMNMSMERAKRIRIFQIVNYQHHSLYTIIFQQAQQDRKAKNKKNNDAELQNKISAFPE